jgi:hypothetical protein
MSWPGLSRPLGLARHNVCSVMPGFMPGIHAWGLAMMIERPYSNGTSV